MRAPCSRGCLARDSVRRDAGGKAQLPSGCWELSSTKTKVLCMSDAVATWNLRIEEAAKECQVLTTQLLLGLREELLSRRPAICALLDTLALLDFLSGYVAYMHAQKEHAAFCRPVICAQTGTYLQASCISLASPEAQG